MADLLHLDQQLCFALYNASRAIVRAYAPILEPLGLTYPQYLVLLVLWDEDGLPVKQLGLRLGLDSGTLTPLLKRLEKSGIVTRRRDRGDQRVVHIHLTAEGKAIKARARRVPIDAACAAGYDVTSERSLARLVALREELTELATRIG